MKKKTYLFALMAMALTLGSCSDNENGIGGETTVNHLHSTADSLKRKET